MFYFYKMFTKKKAKYHNMEAFYLESVDLLMVTVDILVLTEVYAEEVCPED